MASSMTIGEIQEALDVVQNALNNVQAALKEIADLKARADIQYDRITRVPQKIDTPSYWKGENMMKPIQASKEIYPLRGRYSVIHLILWQMT